MWPDGGLLWDISVAPTGLWVSPLGFSQGSVPAFGGDYTLGYSRDIPTGFFAALRAEFVPVLTQTLKPNDFIGVFSAVRDESLTYQPCPFKAGLR